MIFTALSKVNSLPDNPISIQLTTLPPLALTPQDPAAFGSGNSIDPVKVSAGPDI